MSIRKWLAGTLVDFGYKASELRKRPESIRGMALDLEELENKQTHQTLTYLKAEIENMKNPYPFLLSEGADFNSHISHIAYRQAIQDILKLLEE